MPGKLKHNALGSLRPPEGKPYADFPDGEFGLLLRVFASGAGAWMVRYRTADGVQRRVKLGSAKVLTLGQARDRARDLARQVTDGGDPIAERRAAKAAADAPAPAAEMTFAALFDRYQEAARAGRHSDRGRPKAARTLAFERDLYTSRIGPTLGARPIGSIGVADARALGDAVLAAGLSPGRANQAAGIVRAAFGFAVREELLDRNPLTGARIASRIAPPRERVLSREELGRFWRAVGAARQSTDGRQRSSAFAIPFAVLTLARIGEVAGATRDEFDFEAGLWTLGRERMKARKPHVVPLTGEALAVLGEAGAAQLRPGAPVFTGQSAPGAPSRAIRMDVLSAAFGRVLQRAGVDDASAHDLRRTGATMLAADGVDPTVIGFLLAHAGGGAISAIDRVYNLHRYTREKREALERWSAMLNAAAEQCKGA